MLFGSGPHLSCSRQTDRQSAANTPPQVIARSSRYRARRLGGGSTAGCSPAASPCWTAGGLFPVFARSTRQGDRLCRQLYMVSIGILDVRENLSVPTLLALSF